MCLTSVFACITLQENKATGFTQSEQTARRSASAGTTTGASIPGHRHCPKLRRNQTVRKNSSDESSATLRRSTWAEARLSCGQFVKRPPDFYLQEATRGERCPRHSCCFDTGCGDQLCGNGADSVAQTATKGSKQMEKITAKVTGLVLSAKCSRRGRRWCDIRGLNFHSRPPQTVPCQKEGKKE